MTKNSIFTLLLLLLVSFFSSSVYGQKPLKPIRPDGKAENSSVSRRKPKPSGNSYTVSSSVSGSHRGHDYVDLGLPSGLKWAAYNVGSSSPEEYGIYYAWGETSEKSEYTKENSITYDKKFGDISGNSQYDAARYNWGGSWRLPTELDIEELCKNCDYKWTTYKGKNGGLFTSKKNGKKLFLPAAGSRDGISLYDAGGLGYYWSSTPVEDYDDYVCRLYFNADGDYCYGWGNRYDGHSVRPVSE